MSVAPADLLARAERLLAAPEAAEPDWRDAAALAHRALHHLVAAHLGLDPAGFAGSPRAVREALTAIEPVQAPGFIREARRHFASTWLTAERATQQLDAAFGPADARRALACARRVFAARAAAN